jgi:hypothetical protein
MPTFSIRIVTDSGVTGFQPDMPGCTFNQPLAVPQYSLVTWSNETDQPHTLSVDSGALLTEQILPQCSNRTEYYVNPVTAGATSVSYKCTEHPDEVGEIVLSAIVDMPPC